MPLLPFVQEAIAALRYFRADCAAELASEIERLWPSGISWKMLGSIDYRHMLTDRGLQSGGHAAKATALRIIFNVRRAEFEAKVPQWEVANSKVRLWARADFVCGVMQGHDQDIFPWRRSPVLPQPSCDREWCTCHFTVEFED